ncbi:MAG: hypothetical protein JO362_10715 [Streptomycetaceae bacterium]|nr:hypothetical protein [Streptomycetaceae bacterium]
MPTLITVALIAAACYGLLCVCSPFGDCHRCRGFGYKLTTDRKGRPKRGKPCRRCNGHGKRVRIGRRLYNATRRARRRIV